MDIFSAFLLGAVQGLTEFLPVSSSGHLIFAWEVLGLSVEYSLAFDALLHLATAFAALMYFRADFWNMARTFFAYISLKPIEREHKTLFWALAIGTVPVVFFGLLFESMIESIFRSATLVAWVFILGSFLMLAAEWAHKKYYALFFKKKEEGVSSARSLTLARGVTIGFFQAFALIPGMSRSGATISGGLLLGLSREEATRFAFLLSFPVTLGVGLKKLLELESAGVLYNEAFVLAFGALASFVFGILTIHAMILFLRSRTLIPFVIYRITLVVLVLFLVG